MNEKQLILKQWHARHARTWPGDFTILTRTIRPSREYGLPPGVETSVEDLCLRARIAYRVTGGYQPAVFEDPNSTDHVQTRTPDGRWALIVGSASLPAKDPEHAVRMLEILAHSFHDYAARESVRGLFTAPPGRDAVELEQAQEDLAEARSEIERLQGLLLAACPPPHCGDGYQPNLIPIQPILSSEDKDAFYSLSQLYSLDRFRADVRNYEEMEVDFVFTSAKIDGNAYDRVDADNLLRIGITAWGKRFSDAAMIMGLRDGYRRAMGIGPGAALNFKWLCGLHGMLAKRPCDPARADGQLRDAVPVLEEAARYADPFEQSIYLHCNLARLRSLGEQCGRTARIAQTAALVRGGVLPLFFSDTLIDEYRRATLNYCETGDYPPYVSFFKKNYRLAVCNLLGHKYPCPT